MKFGSLFSGIGGFDLGFERAGMECAWQAEFDDKAAGVLARHWPNVINYKDVRNVRRDNAAAVDLICGGFPCQDLSVAGKRAGLAGKRSGLWFEFARIIGELKPSWVVIENVPGLLSSNRGADFAVVLRGLVERGYGVCWRVLDAQYFGVAQRRRRVFIVASLGNGRAAEVLFERESCGGDTPPRRETWEGTSPSTVSSPTASGRGVERTGESRGQDPVVIARSLTPWDVKSKRIHDVNGTAPTLAGSDGGGGQRLPYIAGTLDGKSCAANRGCNANETDFLVPSVGVRRLTPTECERLQGFPDGWTAGQSDSARYKQLGNAVAVPVLEWIGRRIMAVLK